MTDINPEEPVQAQTAAEEKPVETKAEDKKTTEEHDDSATEQKKERVGIVSDASLLPESDDPKEIIKQVEFYFADSNLRFDKFLYGLVGEENKWVDIALVAGFNRMRRFKSLDNIKKALEDSELMELNEEKTKMRRKSPMIMLRDPKLVDKSITRSVYAKGFGAETKTSQFDLEKFFEKTGIKVNAVRLRRDDSKVFKGSVFVEFKTVDDMNKFMELDDKPEWDGQKMVLIDPETEAVNPDKEKQTTAEQAIAEAALGVQYMTKQAYVDMKMKAIQEGKIKAKTYSKNPKFDAFKQDGNATGGRGGRQNGRGGKREGGRDNRDWRERRDDDRKNGFKDRRGGGNHRGRDNRGRGGRDNRSTDNNGPKLRADGVPIVRTASVSPDRKAKKRSRDDEGNNGASEDSKRSKTQAAADVSA
ncbi:hypothetical protein TWF281_010860 [Arthrobotrys megalospora]